MTSCLRARIQEERLYKMAHSDMSVNLSMQPNTPYMYVPDPIYLGIILTIKFYVLFGVFYLRCVLLVC